MEVLLLPQKDARFTSCVLVHGMGGTGKTVAVVREKAVREHYCEIHWLTVGADAVDEKLKQMQAILHRKLTGRDAEGAEHKDNGAWVAMLVEAMVEKERALVVLDDPWLPEQVRFLNPVDGSHTEHRLLVTTRIRELVPKAARIELPLMGKDESVALLLDLAGVQKASYMQQHASASAWPPPAAYAIAAECGLLPITLTIAAQVVRSWGRGWEREDAVLPLLREQGSSTVEERVIGAGLQALDRSDDGAAAKELFHMFAVTQVIEHTFVNVPAVSHI
eukprot:g2556.t1